MLSNCYGGLYKAPRREEKKAKSQEEREIRSSLLILDLRDSMLHVVRFNSFFVDDFGSFQAMPVGKRNASIEVDEIVVGPRAYCNKFHSSNHA